MKKNILLSLPFFLLNAGAFALEGTGVDFGKDIGNIENSLQDGKAGNAAAPSVPRPVPAHGGSSKWWSVDLFGSAHKSIMAASLALTDSGQFPDISRAGNILLTGSNDESGHPDRTHNGGRPEELWKGDTPESLGGVIQNYRHFKFAEAYARLGTICHLTQDQAVPAHAANILHSTQEKFEAYSADGNKVKIEASRDNGEMEPYAYYQDLQDDTRKHLASWVHPKTKVPYWTPAGNAPPLGQDATYGPRGRYGANGRDVYSETKSNDSMSDEGGGPQVTLSPEIRVRQLGMAGAATAGALRSASKRLPPLVSGLSVTPGGKSAAVKFTIFENRSRKVSYSVSLSRDGKAARQVLTGEAGLLDPAAPDLMLKGEVNAALDLSALGSGNYMVDVRVTDEDGNVTPDEVNADDISANDTRAALVIP